MGSCVLVKVRHARLEQRFVLKYLAPQASRNPNAVQAFLSGARAAMCLQSEHAARIVDAGRLAFGAPYVVTETFQGSELRELLRVRGALSPTEAIDFVLQASEAVAEAHRNGLIHGSLSPSTLFVTRRPDGLPNIKVLDFGGGNALRANPLAAKLRDWNQGTAVFWESSRLWDTLAYSAPEQLRGTNEPTPLCDVWALGATLHELLCGSPPFQAESSSALLAAIVADAPIPITSLCNDLPRALESVLLRCLSKEPHARFPTVADLALALRPFAAADAQLAADRIARIQSLDTRQSPLLSPSRAIVRVGSSPAARAEHAVAEPFPLPPRILAPQSPARRMALQLMGSAVLAVLGVLGGTVAGAVVAGRAVSDAASAATMSSPSVKRATSALPVPDGAPVARTGQSAAPPSAAQLSAPTTMPVPRRAPALPISKRQRISAPGATAELPATAEKTPLTGASKEHLFDRMW
jgi:serine/threonine-protein kinase